MGKWQAGNPAGPGVLPRVCPHSLHSAASRCLFHTGNPGLPAPHAPQNGAERGWVLKGVDEVLLLLEDMSLNLQVRGGSAWAVAWGR